MYTVVGKEINCGKFILHCSYTPDFRLPASVLGSIRSNRFEGVRVISFSFYRDIEFLFDKVDIGDKVIVWYDLSGNPSEFTLAE